MWQTEIEEIEKRKKIAYELGGEKGVKRQHDQGKMTVRERINALLDEGSFIETGILSGEAKYENNNQDLVSMTPCPIITGRGMINGRRVIVQGDDFTIRGASVGRMYKAKLAYNGKMSHEMRLPLIRL
jgi:acetyl-CoA carboxylase carboxyltransferase component